MNDSHGASGEDVTMTSDLSATQDTSQKPWTQTLPICWRFTNGDCGYGDKCPYQHALAGATSSTDSADAKAHSPARQEEHQGDAQERAVAMEPASEEDQPQREQAVAMELVSEDHEPQPQLTDGLTVAMEQAMETVEAIPLAVEAELRVDPDDGNAYPYESFVEQYGDEEGAASWALAQPQACPLADEATS